MSAGLALGLMEVAKASKLKSFLTIKQTISWGFGSEMLGRKRPVNS